MKPLRDPRFIYATFNTREKAAGALESLFARGEVSPADKPVILRYGAADPGDRKRNYYAITILEEVK